MQSHPDSINNVVTWRSPLSKFKVAHNSICRSCMSLKIKDQDVIHWQSTPTSPVDEQDVHAERRHTVKSWEYDIKMKIKNGREGYQKKVYIVSGTNIYGWRMILPQMSQKSMTNRLNDCNERNDE